MTSRDFCYWLQGYFEILAPALNNSSLSEEQVRIVKNHLAMVFKHEIDPSFGDKKHQEDLTKIHQTLSGINPSMFETTLDQTLFNC